MVEKTFSGATRCVFDFFAGRKEGEFLRLGSEIIESEELSDVVYKTYLSLLTDGWRGSPASKFGIDDLGEAYLFGFYVPCTRRYVLAGQIDLTNDRLPHHAGFVAYNDVGSDRPLFISCRKVEGFHRGVRCPPFAVAKYSCVWFYEDERRDRIDKRIDHGAFMRTMSTHFAVMPQGTIVPCPDSGNVLNGRISALYAAAGQGLAASINAQADRRHVWNVDTSENLVGATLRTPLVLGVSEEHVKSLFYARSLPVTQTGRKRPILHWVQAHHRRLRDGIDIDVEKHLRGVSKFEMDGFCFAITNPQKPLKQVA